MSAKDGKYHALPVRIQSSFTIRNNFYVNYMIDSIRFEMYEINQSNWQVKAKTSINFINFNFDYFATMNYTKISNNYFIENINFSEKQVVCRLDYNVSIVKNEIVDDFRIYSTIKTINYILDQTPKHIVLVSHLGRPKGYEESSSLKILIPKLCMEGIMDTEPN
jgi:hypothetical protein